MAHVVFAGGGTGGHIYPALAIAESLRELNSATEASWLVSHRAVDAGILEREGAPYTALVAKPFGVRPRSLTRFLGAWGPSVRESRRVIREACAEHGPDQVLLVAMGGFVAPPAVQAARGERVRAILVNLDAVPGRANRWIARRTHTQLTSCDAPAVPASWQRVRPIVRRSVATDRSPEECRREFGLEPDRSTLLVTGGSQGARTINHLMEQVCQHEPNLLSDWQIIHQSGGETDSLAKAYQQAGARAHVATFIDQMGLAWKAADLAISRSGAGAVAEAWASATPAVFMPYPFHKDEHQRLNAAPLVDAGGAVVMSDEIMPSANLGKHRDALRGILQHPAVLEAMREGISVLGPADGASLVARKLMDLP